MNGHRPSINSPPGLRLRASDRKRAVAPAGNGGWVIARILAASALIAAGLMTPGIANAAEDGAVNAKAIQPFLREFCFECHGDGMDKGGVAFDRFASEAAMLGDHERWLKALKNVRAGLMPPARKPQPSAAQRQRLEAWIKAAVFKIDPANLDPGRVTVRRLNRIEYRNTIRDLMGIDFDTEKEFPPDDTGHGFDNLADVLTISPMLLEKYLAAASEIVGRAVPTTSLAPAEQAFIGAEFRRQGAGASQPNPDKGLFLSFYEASKATAEFAPGHAGRFQVVFDFNTTERFVDGQNDYNRARFTLRAGERVLFTREFNREGNRQFKLEFETELGADDRGLSIDVEPLTPDQKQIRALGFRLNALTLRGPLAPRHHVRPKNYERFFPKEPPSDSRSRREYARELLGRFATQAFRRPADPATVDRLARMAAAAYEHPGKTFEAGIAQAMTAVLASPRFLFREDLPAPGTTPGEHPFVDEFSLASRLSYFFWSSMPDDELNRLAAAGQLRQNLAAQVTRLLADPRSEALMRHFPGQWLQARDVESIDIQARAVLTREEAPDPELDRIRARSRELRSRDYEALTPEERRELDDVRAVLNRRFNQPLRADLSGDLRRAMRLETEKTFEHVFRQDRPLVELLDADYAFLNENLARHYGLTNLNIRGEELRQVGLPPDSPRGGLLTQGTVLVVTSNPTRTSPVKRGLFILENILGTPPPPAPPNVPALEEAARAAKGRELSLRETLALHREKPLCSSCHTRMDPPGLALENFNAMGMWRDQERAVPIDPAGTLLSGESFSGVRELKRILVRNHRTDFHHTLSEKLLTYALGRGLEFYDVETVDRIVARLDAGDGRASTLLTGIVESVPFQKRRASVSSLETEPAKPATPQDQTRRPNP